MKKMSSTNTQNDYSRQQALEYMKEIESVTGEVKKALKDGYDENFLIKNGYAIKYTSRSKEILDNQIVI